MRNTPNFFTFVIIAASIVSLRCDLFGETGHRDIDFVETKVVDGFFMGVTDEFGHTNTSPDIPLCFSIWTANVSIWTTNKFPQPSNYVNVVFPAEPEYAYQVELFDTNGVAVPKTEAGKNVGIKYFKFNTNSFYLHATGEIFHFGIRAQLMAVMAKVQPYQMLVIFRPSDLFKIEKPGKYTLRIRFQIIAFPRTGTSRGDYKTELIRFPPMDYPLIKK